MRPALHTIFFYTPFILCIPSVALTIIAVWIIQKKSPQSMQGYKKYLIAITLATFNFDMGMSILVAPKFLPGAFGTENHGIIALQWPSGGRYQLYYICMSLVLEYILCVIGFSYRENSMIKGKTWYARSYKVFQYLVYFICLAGGTVTFYYQSVSEEEARAYMEQIRVNYCRECSIQVIVDAEKTVYMTFVAIIGMLALCSFVGVSILRIKRYLASHSSALSPSTIKLQKMLLKALTWQSFIPFFLMMFPLALEIISFYAVPLVIKNYDPQEIQEDLTALAFLMPSFFSIAHIFCNFYFTAPYRMYILRRLRPARCINVITVTPATVEITASRS